jgi:hypothetical protein
LIHFFFFGGSEHTYKRYLEVLPSLSTRLGDELFEGQYAVLAVDDIELVERPARRCSTAFTDEAQI